MIFYYPGRRPPQLKQYFGLSGILHVVLVLVFWSMLRNQVVLRRTTGLEVAIRTVPGQMKPAIPPKPRPGAAPMPSPALSLAAPRRKIGRIIEKKFKFDMPKIEPQAAALRRAGHEDEVQLAKDKNLAKFIRSENVELIDIDRKDVYQPPAPSIASPRAPEGEYVPASAQANVDVNIQYVEIQFEAQKIDLDAVQWSPAIALKTASGPAGTAAEAPQPPGEPSRRRMIRQVKPEPPTGLDVPEPKVDVILKVIIAESGFIASAEIERSSGYLELDNRALAAIRQCIYESAQKKEARLVRVEYVF